MSAQPVEQEQRRAEVEDDPGLAEVAPVAAAGFEVRRNPVVPAVIGAASGALGSAYLWRAVGTGSALDWALCLLLATMAVGFLRSLLDSRTPLVVADELGLRVRLGPQWRGYPWEAVDRVVLTPRRGLLRDGRLVVRLLDPRRAVEGLEGRALRHARLNTRVYGAALAVPLGATTRVRSEVDDPDATMADRVAALSGDRAEVVTLREEPGPVVPAAAPAPLPRPAQPSAVQQPAVQQPAVQQPAVQPVAVPARPADPRVRPIARLAEPVEVPVVGDYEPEPAYDPVIGPELAAARTRVGLSVDELAERTRIRPHVIESIEVDDFAPCGGDFYARGHIRTLARILGKDPEPLLAQFERRYASAPVTAKRVFEAELATGLTGTIRGTGAAGPNWTLLVGVVLLLVLVWSAVRLFAAPADELLETPPPVLNGSAGLSGFGEPEPGGAAAPAPVPVTVTAAGAGAHVEVRDGEGTLVFEGDLVLGEVKRVTAEPPVTVSSDNGRAVAVVVAGRAVGTVGASDQPATRVLQEPVD